MRLSLMMITILSLGTSPAWAAVNLKQVQVAGGSSVNLVFDGKLSRDQIKIEYFNDVIQLSMQDAAIYPAKISSISGGELTKVFAYQYAPKLVRCRLSVKGKAEDYRSRLIIDQKGKILTVRFAGVGEREAAAPAKATTEPVATKAEVKDPEINDPGEKALLERILTAKPAEAKPVEAPAKAEVKDDAPAPKLGKPETGPPTESKRLTGGKGMGNPMGMIGKTLLVLALFGIFAMFVRKAMAGGAGAGNLRKAAGPLGRFLQRGLSRYGKTGKMIEVVSTHYLGPKKSIAVVRVAGRMLVLGISQENINLITQLNTDAAEPDLGDIDLESLGVNPAVGATSREEPALGASAFDKLLDGEASRPAASPMAAIAPDTGPEPAGVRARIRSRLEGMKPL